MTYPNHPHPPQNLNTMFVTEIRFDPSYFKTPPAILKAIIMLLNLIGLICIESSAFRSNGRGVYFIFVALLGLWCSGMMLLLYAFHAVERYHNIKWLLIEMVSYTVIMFMYLIASTIVVAFGAAAYSAAGFFGYLAMMLYGFEAFIKARAMKAGELAQGQRVVTKQCQLATPTVLPV